MGKRGAELRRGKCVGARSILAINLQFKDPSPNPLFSSLLSSLPARMRLAGVSFVRRRTILFIILAIPLVELLWELASITRIAFTRPFPSSFTQDLPNNSQAVEDIPITVILAGIKKDNLTILEQESGLRPGDEQVVYVADDPSALYRVPMNKGNEAMVYLSFLIDRYDTLPDLMVFMHAGRSAWHNNILLHWDSARTICNLRRSYVRSQGFTNLLCDETYYCTHIHKATDSGYPSSVLTREAKPNSQEAFEAQYAQFHEIWDAIFPGHPVPQRIGGASGAQFALTRETARKVPLTELKRLRQWIIDIDLDAKAAGAVFELLWPMIFLGTKNSVLCPVPYHCYCSVYGICMESVANASFTPERLVEQITLSGRRIRGMRGQLERIRHLGNQIPTEGRDHELAVISAGRIGTGLAGLSDHVALLEKNVTELTFGLDEIVRKASIERPELVTVEYND